MKYRLPYSEPESLEGEARRRWVESHRAAEFSHSLEAQVAGQLDVGFLITGFYEDSWSDEATPLNRFPLVAIATRATKVNVNQCAAHGRAVSGAPVSSAVIALGKARRSLQGESPCRVRASHPPVSSVASVEESRERRTKQ
ncbi:MAG: hypothetical protein ACREYE_05020, partial [Gammaproteobacteria bacterium]